MECLINMLFHYREHSQTLNLCETRHLLEAGYLGFHSWLIPIMYYTQILNSAILRKPFQHQNYRWTTTMAHLYGHHSPARLIKTFIQCLTTVYISTVALRSKTWRCRTVRSPDKTWYICNMCARAEGENGTFMENVYKTETNTAHTHIWSEGLD